MSKSFVLSLLFIVLSVTPTQAQFLLRISGGGLQKASYILGTIHTQPGSVLDSIPEYAEAEAQCLQLYPEFDLLDTLKMKQAQTTGLRMIELPDEKTIFDVLSEEQSIQLGRCFKDVFQVGLKDSIMSFIWHFHPNAFISFFSIMLSMKEMIKYPELLRNVAPGTTIDMTCIARAKERGMRIGYLDKVASDEEVASINDKLTQNLEAGVDSLMAFISHLEIHRQRLVKETQLTVKMLNYWQHRDFAGYSSDAELHSMLQRDSVMFKKRNVRWLPQMVNAMHKAPTMFVVGCGHLAGADGLVEQLRKEGYDVEQVVPTYLAAIRRYLTSEIGSLYAEADYCVPLCQIVAVDESNAEDIRVWGDFWVYNYSLSGDTLQCVSGGNHPGLIHVRQTENGFEVTGFDRVEDGSNFKKSARRIFGKKYKDFMAVQADDKKRERLRAEGLAVYVRNYNIPAACYQDYGWPAKALKQ